MMRLFLLLVLLVASVVAKPRGWGMMARSNSSAALLATRTASAIQARQVTRERLMSRVDKTIMQNLFGRIDCSIPEPSALGCNPDCPDYTLCDGLACYDFTSDPEHCGSCEGTCGGEDPGCCGGGCADLDSSYSHCGACDNPCEGTESCCSGHCTDTDYNYLNCGACGVPCDPILGFNCCGGACIDMSINEQHCGACNNPCGTGQTCCGDCTDTQTDYYNCGSCSVVCDESPGGQCVDGGCSYPEI